MCRIWICLVTGFALAGSAAAETTVVTDKLGKKIEPSLVDASGKPALLTALLGEKATVIVFLSFDCPNSNNYTPTLLALHKEYSKKGVQFIGITETEVTAAELKTKVAEYKFVFPVFADPKFQIADSFKATTTPEAFVLDHNQILRYRGRIDNMYSERLKRSATVTDHDLKNALDDVLSGKPVRTPATFAVGCPIGSREPVVKAPTKVTYHKDVAPILQSSCQVCHRPGEVGPFSLLNYKQAVVWAEDIKKYTASRAMPPWKPSANEFPFHNDRRLSDAEINTLADWVDGGVPEGNTKDAPKPSTFTDGWMLGKPDLILTTNEDFTLGASGHDAFRCYVMPTNLPEDKYIIGFEVKPGNSRIVHHTLNYWTLSDSARKLETSAKVKAKETDKDRGPGYPASMGIGFFPGKSPREDVPSLGNFGGWAPGQVPRFLPEGTGYMLPKGADVVIQTHYHRNGKEEKDRTQIGLFFAKKPVKSPYQSAFVAPKNPIFMMIPANKEDHKIDGTTYLHTDATMHSVMPHMHLIGKSVKVTMTPPGGKPATLVEIKHWDYNWQETYWFKKPLELKAGTRLDIEAIFDNSTKNPNNPKNPPALVTFGEQTTNEMLFGFFGLTTPDNKRIIFRNTPPETK